MSDEVPLTTMEGLALFVRNVHVVGAALMSTPAARLALGADLARQAAEDQQALADAADQRRLQRRAGAKNV